MRYGPRDAGTGATRRGIPEMTSRRGVRIGVIAILITSTIVAGAHPSPASASNVVDLEFLGEQVFPTGTMFDGTQLGGLSSIAYDDKRDVFYSISDDPSQFSPARFYTLHLDVSDGTLDDGDVEFLDVTTLQDAPGEPFAPFSLDPEGLTLTKDDELIVTSEGIANQLIDPFVRRFGLDGSPIGALAMPDIFLPDSPPTRGVRQNLGFESAGMSRSGWFLFAGTEAALVQDGPAATISAGSPARLLRYNLRNGRLDRQYVYWTDPIAEPPVPAGSFAVNGLVEVLPLNNNRLLTMERSFSVGAPGTGNTIKIYSVSLFKADNVNGCDSLAGELDDIRAARKSLLLDLDELGIPLDNIEGMAFGPDLPDGRRSLLLVSDNNFSPAGFTQFLLFAVSD
jgi:hypothetical protein